MCQKDRHTVTYPPHRKCGLWGLRPFQLYASLACLVASLSSLSVLSCYSLTGTLLCVLGEIDRELAETSYQFLTNWNSKSILFVSWEKRTDKDHHLLGGLKVEEQTQAIKNLRGKISMWMTYIVTVIFLVYIKTLVKNEDLCWTLCTCIYIATGEASIPTVII